MTLRSELGEGDGERGEIELMEIVEPEQGEKSVTMSSHLEVSFESSVSLHSHDLNQLKSGSLVTVEWDDETFDAVVWNMKKESAVVIILDGWAASVTI